MLFETVRSYRPLVLFSFIFCYVFLTLQAGIDRANLGVDRTSQMIGEWSILPHTISFSSGELGQTGKVNRAVVVQKYANLIEDMLSDNRQR